MKDQKPYQQALVAMACVLCLWIVQPGKGLIISEIMYHPSEDSEGETLEFIELYNNRAVFEDLSGYAFTKGIRYTFALGTMLGPKQHLVIARHPGALVAAYGIEAVLGPYKGSLRNSGEQIELSSNYGEIVLSFAYETEPPWPVSPDGTGHSLQLAQRAGDPEEGSSWSSSSFIGGTPGQAHETQAEAEEPSVVTLVDLGHAGSYFKGTEEPAPDAYGQASTVWTDLAFDDNPDTTPWLEGPSGYGYSNEADESQYIQTELDDMDGGYMSVYARLRFNLTAQQIASFTQLSAEVHYDDGFVLYLNGTRVGASTQIFGTPPTFDWPGGSAADPQALQINLTDSMDLLLPGTNVLAIQAHNARLAGSSDAYACPILRALQVKEFTASDNPNAKLLINELQGSSGSIPGADWIELYNPGPVAVDLSNLYLSHNRLNLLQYGLPAGIVLQPGEFWAMSKGRFPDGFPFAFPLSGGTIYLTAATDDPVPVPIRVLDAVQYSHLDPDLTFGRYPDGSASWDSLAMATYGTPNAQALLHDVVINEIMYHHITREERYEYVELYNRADNTVLLSNWAFTSGIDYTFPEGTELRPHAYLIVAKDPDFLASHYDHLTLGENLIGPYAGSLNDHSECIQLAYPFEHTLPGTNQAETYSIIADEVTYYDGGRWPVWADGQGASLELRDPRSNNNTPNAWAASLETDKTHWEPFSYAISAGDRQYTHDQVTIFDLMLLNRGEILLDDLELTIQESNQLTNGGFEGNQSPWRILGNHVQSSLTRTDQHSGTQALHLIATGHGDPGANRINQSITGIQAGSVTFKGWARWLRGSPFLLVRTSREQSPTQPPRPAHAFKLSVPMDLGSPGQQNTVFESNRSPDILDVKHAPVIPQANEPIVVSARITDPDGVRLALLKYRSEGDGTLSSLTMVDDGTGDDRIAGDHLYTATIPGGPRDTMRSFHIEATDGIAVTRFPTRLDASADVPDRSCLVRVQDTAVQTEFATYRVWMSNAVMDSFQSRPNLSNELMDCTFVYNDSEIFYNCGIRHRGSPFLRSGTGRSPYPADRHGFRIEFNADQKFGNRDEINLDGTEGGNRGPLQERASYWFYRQMGLECSRQEFVRLIMNGRIANIYEDVQKIDGNYLDTWFPGNNKGYLHKIDDYFEYSAQGTGHRNYDEGLKYDQDHPLLKETYRWGFEKRSHRENDNWGHLFDFAKALNTPSDDPAYEEIIESVLHPQHFATVLALRHAVGDWDSYGHRRGKNNFFYYALPEGKWYLLPWDIDFTLGSGDGPNTGLIPTNRSQFPEVYQFLQHPKYKGLYYEAFAALVNGPWQTSYGTANPPTDFDRFLDASADALIAEGLGSGRRDGIKSFVRSRRNYIVSRILSIRFEISTQNGKDFCTPDTRMTIQGLAPLEVMGITVNGTPTPASFAGTSFSVELAIPRGASLFTLQGLDDAGNPIPGATDSITITGGCR
jgi:hypothetical protein